MRPNVLPITADQWRGDCLGVAGHPVVKTPNIDRFAGEATYFARHVDRRLTGLELTPDGMVDHRS